jgi:hypothetical protein
LSYLLNLDRFLLDSFMSVGLFPANGRHANHTARLTKSVNLVLSNHSLLLIYVPTTRNHVRAEMLAAVKPAWQWKLCFHGAGTVKRF